MYFGKSPRVIGLYDIKPQEMFFYQYLPIKMQGKYDVRYEKRLRCFNEIIGACIDDYIYRFGDMEYYGKYVYLTAKRMYISPGKTFNRPGWHSDGFMTDDINYIWYDCNPTIFNSSKFSLTPDDEKSIEEMKIQALPENDFSYPENTLLMLDQFSIHRVSEARETRVRTFVKVSFSDDRYDLEGNSHNYDLDYIWDMRPRKEARNIPQFLSK